MAFAEILLPIEISRRSSGGPMWETTVTRLDSGREKRNQPWSQELGQWDIGGYLKTIDHVHDLLAFFNARQGMTDGFLFLDPFDHAIVSQNIGTGTGALTTFQLIKTYTSGTSYNKTLYKPKLGGMAIYKAGVLQVETTDYTLNYATGLVTFTVAPAAAAAITATGTFYKPIRFDVKHLSISYADLRQGTVRVPIVELRL